jgi:4-amino-4-deoxy-L-arabinose transferase-like glycosyltransferase
MMDVPLVFFTVTSIYFYVLSEEAEKTKVFAVLSGLFFGLALMTKQFSAFIIPIILFAYLAVTKRNIWFIKTKRFAWFFWVGIAVFLPWLLYMTLCFGPDFLKPYFLESVIARSTSSLEGHVGTYWYYFAHLGTRETLPWIILLPFAVSVCTVNAFAKRSKADTLVVVWMTAVLLVFTIIQTKIYWYIMPAFPAFAFAIGSLLYQLSAKIHTRISKRANQGPNPLKYGT